MAIGTVAAIGVDAQRIIVATALADARRRVEIVVLVVVVGVLHRNGSGESDVAAGSGIDGHQIAGITGSPGGRRIVVVDEGFFAGRTGLGLRLLYPKRKKASEHQRELIPEVLDSGQRRHRGSAVLGKSRLHLSCFRLHPRSLDLLRPAGGEPAPRNQIDKRPHPLLAGRSGVARAVMARTVPAHIVTEITVLMRMGRFASRFASTVRARRVTMSPVASPGPVQLCM